MPGLLSSYLSYARGECAGTSPWGLLRIFSATVATMARLRNALYDRGVFASSDPPLPVVSVGNLCHGGTNKTPMVETLARELKHAGMSVGIVSRGYGGSSRAPLWIGGGDGSACRDVAGDEPLMLANRLPDVKVVISPDRHLGVRLLRELGADVVVADDAFQHRRMGRDLDVVLIDATCPFGNGHAVPAGILREMPESLRRADIVIVTKANHVSGDSLARTIDSLNKWISREDIFTARVCHESWLVLEGGKWRERCGAPGRRAVAFSAIANPDSFRRTLVSLGIDVALHRVYRDHHRFTWKDIDDLEHSASVLSAEAFVCTEKDMYNLPDKPHMLKPLYVPKIAVSIDERERFWARVARKLRPSIVVASNGYGEDAIGALLARKLAPRFPGARISAFCLVGSGRAYRDVGTEVISPASEMPSGGVVKYSLRALLRDLRHGLGKDIGRQIETWRRRAGKFRTPLCVGDGYLLAHTLWGQGKTPILAATAKTVRLNGHWALERFLLRRRCLKVWTRDDETACNLRRHGIDAVFSGSPIMDLAIDDDDRRDIWAGTGGRRVLLLPGSRPRAYDDVKLLLESAALLNERTPCSFVMVVAATIDRGKLFDVPQCASLEEDCAVLAGGARVRIYSGPVATASRGAEILIGLGGTANQVAAGLGVPVVSIVERGKKAQKKLLGDAELLTLPSAASLAASALAILDDPTRAESMSKAGMKNMGGPGALASIVEYAADELGWDARVKLYRRITDVFSNDDKEFTVTDNGIDRGSREEDAEWRKALGKRSKITRFLRIRRITKGR